jgi:hypothetical protein
VPLSEWGGFLSAVRDGSDVSDILIPAVEMGTSDGLILESVLAEHGTTVVSRSEVTEIGQYAA